MNVALFASAFYPHVGGVEELVRQLAHAYRDKGIKPIVLTNRWPRNLPEYEEYEGIPLYRLPMRVPDGGLKAQVSYKLTHAAIVRNMLAILKKHRTDLLHIQCVSSNGYYALLAHRSLDLPLVVTAQGERTMDASGLYQRSVFMNKTLRQLLEEADYITGCSKNTLEDLENYCGHPFGERSQPVYNGIRLADFEDSASYSHNRPYILGIGRLVKQKGFDILIKAYAQSVSEYCDLLLAGEGPEREPLELLVEELGMQDRVLFMGRADRPKAVSLFKGCVFFVLPSRMEPFGIVNLEAMAAGKAIVATRVGGVPEFVVDGENGILVPGEDVEAMSEALKRMACDDALRIRMEQANIQKAKQFDWSSIADQYLAIYDKVAAESSRVNL